MRYSALLVFAFVFGFGALSVSAQCDPYSQGNIACSYYNEGFRDGQNDANTNRSRDYRRYRDKYERRYENNFRDGYNAGYDSMRQSTRWNDQQRRAYDVGFNIGQEDRRRRTSDTRAAEGLRYDQSVSQYWLKGYDDGFNGRRRNYDQYVGPGEPLPGPVTPTYPPVYPPTYPPTPTYPPVYPPTYPGNPGGSASGSASWSGRVDDRGNIVIRGNQMYVENVSGNEMRTTYQNMNGSLPRRAADVSARRVDGRGSVSVIQQPTRQNNFTAIVQVVDTRGGADNYRIDISWNSTGPVEEPYSSGSVRWRGRVDQTVQITVAGSDVSAQDMTQTGLSDVDYSMNGYLATRPGTVTVRKRRGRGTVTVLQQPSAYNGFVAVVQIFDPNGGSDNYEVEIHW